MRISDWSSDVCSSELLRCRGSADAVLRANGTTQEEGGESYGQEMSHPIPIICWLAAGSPMGPRLHPFAGEERHADDHRRHTERQQLEQILPRTAKFLRSVAPPCSSDERRVGKECVSTCRSRCSTFHEKKYKILPQEPDHTFK